VRLQNPEPEGSNNGDVDHALRKFVAPFFGKLPPTEGLQRHASVSWLVATCRTGSRCWRSWVWVLYQIRFENRISSTIKPTCLRYSFAKFTLINVAKICKNMSHNIVMLNWDKCYSIIESILVIGITKFTCISKHRCLQRAGSEERCWYVTRGVRRYIREKYWAARYGGKGGSIHRVYAKLWKFNLVVRDVHRISAYSPAAKRRMRRKTLLSNIH
jgi:hypothetical protein